MRPASSVSSSSASFTSLFARAFCVDWRVSCERNFLLCIWGYFFASSGGGDDGLSDRGSAVCCETDVAVGSSKGFFDGPAFGRESCTALRFLKGLRASAFATSASMAWRQIKGRKTRA